MTCAPARRRFTITSVLLLLAPGYTVHTVIYSAFVTEANASWQHYAPLPPLRNLGSWQCPCQFCCSWWHYLSSHQAGLHQTLQIPQKCNHLLFITLFLILYVAIGDQGLGSWEGRSFHCLNHVISRSHINTAPFLWLAFYAKWRDITFIHMLSSISNFIHNSEHRFRKRFSWAPCK